MGRSKPVPKRRRIGQEDAERKAIETLQSLPGEAVEAAAADVLRNDIQTWNRLDNEDNINSKFSGLGRCTLDQADFGIFQRLHELVREQASASMTSWSGSTSDPRQRAFGFLPGTLGSKDSVRSSLDISQPNVSLAEAAVERPRNAKAMVVLAPNKEHENLLEEAKGAIERLCSQLASSVIPADHQKYLRYSQLVAAQPNLHNGRHLLPLHVDHPSKDGFGIIIVTIAIVGSANVMLESVAERKQGGRAVFSLPERGAYLLSGPVRNTCQHGVLAAEDSGHRESLNLRFGLHGRVEGHDPPAWDVLQHWSDEKVETHK